MPVLHILTTSPFQSSALTECLSLAAAGDALLFLGDGVYSTTQADARFEGKNVYVLQEHADARGVPHAIWAHYIDFDRVVELTELHHPVQTWF